MTAVTTIHGEPATGDSFADRRRTGIGGSDTGGILGVSPYSSALAVFEEKRGLAPAREPSERMVWGTRLERAILDGYAEDHRVSVRRGRFHRHAEHPFVIGHPDAFAGDKLLEVKTTAYLDGRWGDDGSDEIPAHYYSQVQHYLILTSKPAADLILLVGGRELHTYTVEADADFQAALLDEERAFWQRVIDNEPPQPDGSESAGQVLRRMFPRALPDEVIATPEVAMYATAYLSAREMRDEGQARMDKAAQLMQVFMGARERLIGPGFSATWSERRGSVSWKGVADEYREAAASFAHALASADIDHEALEVELAREWEQRQEQHRGASSRSFTFTKRRTDD